MNLPNGHSADRSDPIVLLNIWAHYCNTQNVSQKEFIFAGMGKPSYLLNEDLAESAYAYWNDFLKRIKKVKRSTQKMSFQEASEKIIKSRTSIDYDLPEGTVKARTIMAEAVSDWYNVPIAASDIIFTVGSISSLRMIFDIINAKNPQGKIITTVPFYPFYNNSVFNNNLERINLLELPGYKLTADAIGKIINKLIANNTSINGILLCEPHNPLGGVLDPEELKKLAVTLKQLSPTIPIILDEAYAELVFNKKHISLLTIAPELKDRLLILRSGTKAFSASGERVAIIICFNKKWYDEIRVSAIVTYLHAPKSLQLAYANAMKAFNDKKLSAITKHYQAQIEYADIEIKKMGIQLPDPLYRVESTFYIIVNLSTLFGQSIPLLARQAVGDRKIIETDVDICFTLLFEENLMLCPLSFFGIDPKLGFVRITCSAGIKGLTEIFNRIKNRLTV